MVRLSSKSRTTAQEFRKGARERIFQPFFTTRERGSGIGLASVHKVVSAHGGTIELVNEAAEGTCFRLRLPGGEGDGTRLGPRDRRGA